MTIPLIKQEKLYQKVANTIISLIKQGMFNHGDFLPPERILAKQLGVSRTSLRDGLIVLEISNWVKIEPGNGVIVSADNLVNHDDNYSVKEILDCRMIVDAACARQTALLADKADKQALQDQVAEMDNAIDQHNVHEFYSQDKRFHLAISAACQNQILHHFSGMLWAGRVNIPYAGLEVHEADQQVLRTLNQQHWHIVDAIVRGDAAQAAHHAVLHIQFVRKIISEPAAPLTSEQPAADGEISHTVAQEINLKQRVNF